MYITYRMYIVYYIYIMKLYEYHSMCKPHIDIRQSRISTNIYFIKEINCPHLLIHFIQGEISSEALKLEGQLSHDCTIVLNFHV